MFKRLTFVKYCTADTKAKKLDLINKKPIRTVSYENVEVVCVVRIKGFRGGAS